MEHSTPHDIQTENAQHFKNRFIFLKLGHLAHIPNHARKVPSLKIPVLR